MRRVIVALVAAGLSLPVLAEPIPYVYPFNAMSGQEVVERRLKQPKSQLDYIDREKAEAYLNGIKDAAHGRDWCLAQPILPQDLNLELVQRLRARAPGELRANAAPLVLAELRQRFPCAKPAASALAKPGKKAAGKAAKRRPGAAVSKTVKRKT